MRIWAIRVAALAILLLLALLAVLGSRTLSRLPDTVVYFVQSHEGSFTLERAYRRTVRGNATEHARAAIRELVEGPTPAEDRDGLSTALPQDLEVRGVDLQGDVLYVDLSSAFERGGGSALMRARLEQLRWTLTQPTDVRALALSIEGEPLHVLGGEGLLVERPWFRTDDAAPPRW
jgi:spore germination protein GerM